MIDFLVAKYERPICVYGFEYSTGQKNGNGMEMGETDSHDKLWSDLRFEAFMVVKIQVTVFWVVLLQQPVPDLLFVAEQTGTSTSLSITENDMTHS